MLILHLIATSVMVGVIWVIQLVHYPSFHFIELKQYTTFQRFQCLEYLTWLFQQC